MRTESIRSIARTRTYEADQRNGGVTVDQFIGRSLIECLIESKAIPLQIVIFIDSLQIDRLECLIIERFSQIDLAFRPMNQTMVLIGNDNHIVILLRQSPFVQWTFSNRHADPSHWLDIHRWFHW
jgi:hypothetical protein